MHNSNCSPNGAIICQQKRTQDLNDRIFSRFSPFFKQPPRYDSRPVSTVRTVMPVLGSNEVCNGQDVKPGFNVDLETVLHNRHFALQRSELNEYIPSSTSTLYNDYIPNKDNVTNAHPYLNNAQNLSSFNPNKYNLGRHRFNNATRNQLLNIKP